MANIVIGYKNLCLESGVTFTPDSESADFDADNLAIPHPAEPWRITDLTETPGGGGPEVLVSFTKPEPYQLVAPLYVTASPHRNLVEDGYDLSGAAWTQTNLDSVAIGSAVFTGTNIPQVTLNDADTGSPAQHKLAQTYGHFPSTTTLSPTIRASIYVSETLAVRHLRLRLEGDSGSDEAYIDVNTSTGAINSSTAAGEFSSISASTAELSSGEHRVDFSVTAGNVSTLTVEIILLDGTFSDSYDAGLGNGTLTLGGCLVQWGSDLNAAFPSPRGSAAFWNSGLSSATTYVGTMNMLGRDNMADWYASRPWFHMYKLESSESATSQRTITFINPGNEDGHLDVGALYIGPVWQPANNIDDDISWKIDPETGARILSIRWSYLTEADAWGEGVPMALRAGVGSRYTEVAEGGQEYRADRKMVLVIIDPDGFATDYDQEGGVIYGYLESFEIGNRGWNPALAANVYGIEMTVKEVLP